MTIELPAEVKKIISVLEDAGYEAYAVGGCVRDSLFGQTPHDWDITTSAEPQAVKSLFNRTIDTGLQHGTVTVRMGGQGFEVTTYRIDGDYGDGRHPDSVSFTKSLEEDLKRRDFTINAMAYNDEAGLVDIFGGQEDLKRGLIRCVGAPEERFREDALRILRAARFAARFGFEIDPEAKRVMKEKAETLHKVSAERIREEFVKLIVSPHPDMVRTLYELGLTAVFLPEFDTMMATPQNTEHHMYDVGEHTIHVMENVPEDKVLRLAALFHDVGKPACRKTDAEGTDHFLGHPALGVDMTADIMRRLKFDNATIESVTRLVRFHDERFPVTARNVRRFISRLGSEYFDDMLVLKRADVLGQSMYQRKEKLDRIDEMDRVGHEIMNNAEPLSVKDLAIGGKDLMDLGIARGPEIGAILKALLREVVDEPERNERETLLEEAEKLHTSGF